MNDIKKAGLAAAAVGTSIVAASRSADAAAEESARCISTLIEQRRLHGLPLDTALEELDLLALALRTQLTARSELIRARLALVRLPQRLGIAGYGPSCPCDETVEPRPSGELVELRAA
jgi:type II secretory pathway pseudopilin PulG